MIPTRMSCRVISSRQTEIGWVTTPLIFIAGTVVLIGVLHFGWFANYYRRLFPVGLSPVAINLLWGGWLLLSLFSMWWSFRLKRVALDGETIHISDFLTHEDLPLGEILEVSENRWLKIHPITLEFAGATAWGHAVHFMPKIRFLVPGWVSHPIVAELRDRVRWTRLNQRVGDKLQQDALALPREAEP